MKISGNGINAIIIAAFAWLVVTMQTPYGLATTPDSLSYLDMAANMHNGQGALATDFSLDNNGQPAFIEQRLWPVLYPALLSIFVDNLSDTTGAASLAKILFIITALLTYLILARHLQRFLALPATLLFCLATPMTTIYTYAWSETVFVPLMLMAAWLAIVFMETAADRPGQKYITSLLMLATLIALFYTRYIGLAFFVVIPLIYMRSRNRYPRLFAAMGVAYILAAAAMLIGNYRITGSFSGGVRSVANKSLVENLQDALAAMQVIVTSAWIPALGIIAVLLAFTAIYAFARKNGHPALLQAPMANTVHVLVSFSAIYLLAILALRTYSTFDDIDVRFLAPAFPFIWILLCTGMAFNIDKKWHGIAGFVIPGFLVLLLPIKGYLHLLSSMESWRTQAAPGHYRTLGKTYANFTLPENNNPLKNILDEVLQKNVTIITEKPLFIAFVTGRKTIIHPQQMDLAYLTRMNSLPRAILLLEKGQDPFSQLRQTYDINYASVELKNIILVQLPVNVALK